MKKKCSIMFFSAVAMLVCHMALALEPGEKAPELQILQWIKAGPVKISDGLNKNVYVIEFWATWCPPCKISIPNMSELQAKHAAKGLISVGISTEDEKTVKSFVAEQKKMDYCVAIDDSEKTFKAYMGRETSIPTAFVVGTDGTLLWKGHPMELDKVLNSVFSGTFDMEAQRKIGELHRKMQEAMQNESLEDLTKLSEELLALDPTDDIGVRSRLYVFEAKVEMEKAPDFVAALQLKAPKYFQLSLLRLDLLNQLNRPAAQKRAEMEKAIGAFNDNCEALNAVAWLSMDRLAFGTGSAKLALAAAKRSVEIMPGDTLPSKKAYFLNCLARAYFNAGILQKAVEIETEAVAAAKGTEEEKQLSEILEYFKEAMELSNAGASAK